MPGYDDPIDDEAADLLGRAGFARELAALAVASPFGWTARIGVYGQWGEGKTSAVRLAQRYLEGEGHLTVDYNPWGCRDPQEMVGILADAILERLKLEDKEVPGGIKRKAKRAGGALAKTVQKAENVDFGLAGNIAVNAASRLSPWLQRWAGERREDIAKALQVIEANRRLIVFVDDVDRLDPKLLPMLMFALHEAFAIPGVTFLVALDPAVVGAALTEYHSGFGDGLAFLEKIVQFPRWLPPVAEEDLLRVAESDRKLHAPFVSASVLTDNRQILPRNPRELRMLIRGLMPLRRAFERHDADELDQNLLLLLACFRQRFPQTLLRMLQREKLLDMCGMSAIDRKMGATFLPKVRELAVLSKELEVDERGDRATRFEQLVAEFSERSIRWNAQSIRYHSNLTDRPDAVTWKEFRALMVAPPETSAALDEWMAKHASLVKAPVAAVGRELFEAAVRYHGKTMDESATAGTTEAQGDRVRRVSATVNLLQLLWFASAQRGALCTARHFRVVVGTFRHWAHFDLNENDREQRTVEAALLDEMIAVVDDPAECLALLTPWNHDDFQANAAALTERITRGLVERAAVTAIDRFAEPSGISTMYRSKQHAAEYVLMQCTPTWLDENRKRLLAHAGRSGQVVADNVRLFAEVLVEPKGFSSEARALLADRSLVELLWSVITAVRWQARFFRGLDKLRVNLEGASPLPLPSWWEEARQLAHSRDPKPQTSERDDGHDPDDVDDGEHGLDENDEDEETEEGSGS